MQKNLPALLWRTLLLTALIFGVLQCRHPFFTMTDDNLAAGYPFFSEVGHHLLNGESPWYSGYIFGGGYNLLRDPQYFCWHPFYLLTSLLAGTSFHLYIMDIDAFFLYLVTAAGFVSLASYLRQEQLLHADDGWIVFCSLSYTFTMMALVTCASWLTFEANAGALPWLVLGILQKQWRWGVGIIALVSIHQMLGGHPEPLISNSISLTLFAAAVSWWRRSSGPLVMWFAGYLIAVVVILPLLIPAAEGFLSSARSQGDHLSDVQTNNIPASLFALSLFFGTALTLLFSPPPGTINGIYMVSLGSCAVAWCFLLTFRSRTPWKFLEGASLGLAFFSLVLICRPVFISEIMAHLPLLKSMRWPFRELVQFQFFFHLFLLLRPVRCEPRTRFLMALASSTIFAVPMLLYQVTPTFNDMPLDRQIVLNDKLEPYWAKVGVYLKPGDRVVVLLPTFPEQTDSMTQPYSLMGGYDYPMLTHIVSGSGYSQTPPLEQLYLKTPIFTPWGAFRTSQRDVLLQERPDLKFITLEHTTPLKITLSSRDGPTIDLTPLMLKSLEVNGSH